MPRHPMPWLPVLLLAAALFAGATVADDESKTNPLVAEVLKMVEADVSSTVILDWLRLQDDPTRAVSSTEVLELSDAGASDKVIQELMGKSARGSSRRRPPAPGLPPSPKVAPPAAAIADETAEVAFVLRYRSDIDGGDEFSMRWALYAYLDGEFLIWSRSEGSFSKKSVTMRRTLEPGRHMIRLLRESHKEKGKKGWRHEALVCPETIVFDVEPGADWKMEMTWVTPMFGSHNKGPLTWELSRRDNYVSGADRIGERIDRWPQLCEDMEANTPEGKKTPVWVARELKGCAGWPSLWEGVEDWPAREEVRARLEQDDFRPARGSATASNAPSDP